MSSALRVAVIGAGQIAQRGHLPGFAQAGAELVALCDTSRPELEALAAQYSVKRVYRDWRTMLADGGFDAVSICTPPYLHCEMAIEAAQHGMHVLVEKPMAISLEECGRMIIAAEQAGVLLMVSHNQRFIAAHQMAKEILDSGALGRPYMVHGVFGHSGPEMWSPAQKWYFRADRAGRGVIADLGYHKIDLVRWMTGQEVVQVSAFASTFEKDTSLEDSAVISFQLSGGVIGTLHVSWVFRPDWENSLVIRCVRGVIRVPTEETEPLQVLSVNNAGRQVSASYHCQSGDPSGWFGAVKAFVDAALSDKPSPVPGAEGRATMAAVLSAAQAVEQKKIVSLTDLF